ncbi:MAG: hypothetical protein ABI607_07590 [Betaproteobacteria bacterium]
MSPTFRWAAACLSCLVPVLVRADVTVVEYHHASFDHYFITSKADEIAILDSKVPPFQEWSRTGLSFKAYANAGAPGGSVGICRFFNDSAAFAPKSSHFYAPHGLGCEDTIAAFPDWKLEDANLFNAMLPDAAGKCPAGTIPVYRLYNNGQGGAPNHRFVTSKAVQQTMLAQGYVAEPAGTGVGMCVPPAASAAGLWRGTTDQGQAVLIFILDDGTYYIVYSPVGKQSDAGVIYGSASTENGKFMSTELGDFSLTPIPTGFIGGDLPISGTFVPRGSLQLSNGQSSVTAAYDNAYDTQVTLASLAGPWTVSVGHVTQGVVTTGLMDSQGHMTVSAIGCDFVVTLTPRGTTNVFNMKVVTTRGGCTSPISGHFFYDAANQKIFGLAKFYEQGGGPVDMFHLIGTR